ncbi:MAG TPA: hypothetical protein DDY91_24255 [Planctomycetaceae bacterium]|nr:hypothetical protein [Planctomycetaceae bacterium]
MSRSIGSVAKDAGNAGIFLGFRLYRRGVRESEIDVTSAPAVGEPRCRDGFAGVCLVTADSQNRNVPCISTAN